MLFAIITFLSAFLIEGIGTYISILGLSALFAFNPVIIAMAVALDVGKLVAVSFIYKNWQKVNWLMKSYMTIASVVLVFITSMGAFGFLSGEFQKAIASNSTQNIQITALTEEQARLQKRKDQIDKQIAELPTTYSRGRVTVINGFKEETTRINARLAKIDEELPKLKVENIEKSVKIGPILYVAEAFKTTPEIAVKWVILTIIFVFDPLAIALLLAGNFLLQQRSEKKQAPTPKPGGGLAPIEPAENVQLLAPSMGGPVLQVGDGTWVVPGELVPPPAPEAEKPVEQAPEVVVDPVPQVRVPQQLTIEENPDGPDLVKREPPTTKFETVNSTKADVFAEDDVRRIRSTRELVNKYQNIPAVSVGGPFRK